MDIGRLKMAVIIVYLEIEERLTSRSCSNWKMCDFNIIRNIILSGGQLICLLLAIRSLC